MGGGWGVGGGCRGGAWGGGSGRVGADCLVAGLYNLMLSTVEQINF